PSFEVCLVPGLALADLPPTHPLEVRRGGWLYAADATQRDAGDRRSRPVVDRLLVASPERMLERAELLHVAHGARPAYARRALAEACRCRDGALRLGSLAAQRALDAVDRTVHRPDAGVRSCPTVVEGGVRPRAQLAPRPLREAECAPKSRRELEDVADGEVTEDQDCGRHACILHTLRDYSNRSHVSPSGRLGRPGHGGLALRLGLGPRGDLR